MLPGDTDPHTHQRGRNCNQHRDFDCISQPDRDRHCYAHSNCCAHTHRDTGAYAAPRSAYYVLEESGRLIGCAGIAPLEGGEPDTFELRKMYFLPEARDRGLGEQRLRLCLDRAKELGFRRCYLETLTGMDAAKRLYERLGFRRLCGPLGATGHFGCDQHYVLEL